MANKPGIQGHSSKPMGTKFDYIRKTCDMVAAQGAAAYPGLTLHYIVHTPGQLAEVLPLADDALRRHRAYDGAHTILDKTPMLDRSSLLGISMKSGSGFLGLGKRHHFLALININIDDVEDSRHARHLAYHLAWHAIDLMHYRLEPANMERLQDSPMVPKRSAHGLAMANLKADIFAASMNFMQGQKNAPDELSKARAMQSITPYRLYRIEDYPYVIAAEATQYALGDLEKRGIPSAARMVKASYTLAGDITHQIEDSQIKQWSAFASPAQNMAWAGHPCEEILGAAVNTSENPYIRTTGYLVSQFTGIAPLSASTMMSRYNSFTSFERNERLHRERMESMFEAALSKSITEESSDPLKQAANQQNEELAEGNILGWCASALQDAGETFTASLPAGKDKAADIARHRFNDQKEHSDWNNLVELGEKIIDEKRSGYAVTLTKLADMTDGDPAFSSVHQSVQSTLHDPSYTLKLQAANDLRAAPRGPSAAAPRGPAPRGPAPRTPAPRTPAPLGPVGPAGPTLGGSGSQLVRARELIRQKHLAEQQARETKE